MKRYIMGISGALVFAAIWLAGMPRGEAEIEVMCALGPEATIVCEER